MEKREGYITIDSDVKIFYQILNESLIKTSSPLLVFLHEGLGSVAQWKDFPALLSEKTNLPALLFDREGYGKSSKLKKQNNWDYLNNQAEKALPEIFLQLGFEKKEKILIGHSDGGSIAIIHTGSFPENIIGVITEASHQFIEDISVKGIQDALTLYESGTLKDLLKRYHGENTDSMFYGWADTWLREGFQKWNIEKYLDNVNVPFLGIQGEDDQYGSYAQLASIKEHAAKAEIFYVPQCGHTPHLQKKNEILERMDAFIKTFIFVQP